MNPKSFQHNHCRWSIGLLVLVLGSCTHSASNDATSTENPDAETDANANENAASAGDSDGDEVVDLVEFAHCQLHLFLCRQRFISERRHLQL